jgi:hypothetical protein
MNNFKPIIFNGPMVQAILNTEPGVWPAEPIEPSKPYKCMTRRVIKINFLDGFNPTWTGYKKATENGYFFLYGSKEPATKKIKISYNAGDVLWVRETFLKYAKGQDGGSADRLYAYKADATDSSEELRKEYLLLGYPYKWRPSIHIPRAASRLTLEIKDVRIERVQDISEGDAKAEGVDTSHCFCGVPELKDKCHRHKFMELWDKLNAKRGYPWDSNPWVYVIEFMRAA